MAVAVPVWVAPAVAWAVPTVNSVAVHPVAFESPDGEKPVQPVDFAVVPSFVYAVEITGSLVAPAVVGFVLSDAQAETPHHLVALTEPPVSKPA